MHIGFFELIKVLHCIGLFTKGQKQNILIMILVLRPLAPPVAHIKETEQGTKSNGSLFKKRNFLPKERFLLF